MKAQETVEVKASKRSFLEGNAAVFFFFLLVNLPLWILTFNHPNWSDDYQYIHLFSTKAKFSSLASLLFLPIGGHPGTGQHFCPFYNLINYAITSFTVDPRIIHFLVVLVYAATAYGVYLTVDTYTKDKILGLLSGTLFAINYYIGWTGLTWNCFHAHVTNTFTGTLSVYFFLRYLDFSQARHLLLSSLFLLLSILNVENGFVFFPALCIVALFYWVKKKITIQKLGACLFCFSLVMSTYPLGSYFLTGDPNPMSYRFKWERSPQGYAFVANELFIKSSGLAFPYYALAFNPLKRDAELKETIVQFVRGNELEAIRKISVSSWLRISLLGLFALLMAAALLVLVMTRVKKEIALFGWIYLCLLGINVFIFYRTDVGNAISIFSSIVIAAVILSFLRDPRRWMRNVGIGTLAVYFLATVGTLLDGFNDCYQKSLYKITSAAFKGPDTIYREINRKVGHFIEHGLLLFTHDYRPYHRTTGFERIGDLISLSDYACFNASVFRAELLRTHLVDEYRDKSFYEFYRRIGFNPNHQHIRVRSKEEALDYLKENGVDLDRYDAVYITPDYDVHRLNEEVHQ